MSLPVKSQGRASDRDSGKKILVTGSSGVVGRRLVQQLRERGFGDRTVAFFGDVSSGEDVKKFVDSAGCIGACVHLAAVVPLATANDDPVRTYEVNAVGTGRIIDAIGRKSENAYFLHCSTSHVYSPSGSPLSESAPTGPSSVYGRSKLAAEQLAADVASQRTVRLAVARIFSLWAEDQQGSFLYPSLMRRFSAAQPGDSVRVAGGSNVRDFLHADEVARLLVELLLREVSGVVNIASGEPRMVLDFARDHAPEGISVDSDDAGSATTIVADTARLRELLNG